MARGRAGSTGSAASLRPAGPCWTGSASGERSTAACRSFRRSTTPSATRSSASPSCPARRSPRPSWRRASGSAGRRSGRRSSASPTRASSTSTRRPARSSAGSTSQPSARPSSSARRSRPPSPSKRPSTAAGVTVFEPILERQERAIRDGDFAEFFASDEDLHRKVFELAGHGATWRLVQSAKSHLDRVRQLERPAEATLLEMLRQHRAIATAIVAGDAAAVAEVVREHCVGDPRDRTRRRRTAPGPVPGLGSAGGPSARRVRLRDQPARSISAARDPMRRRRPGASHRRPRPG